MASSLARFLLLGAAVAVLVASVTRGPVSTLLAMLAAALFPPALLFLAARDDKRAAVWIGALSISLVAGLAIAVFWRGSPVWAGLPLATWLTWLLAGMVPFVVIVFGWVLRRRDV